MPVEAGPSDAAQSVNSNPERYYEVKSKDDKILKVSEKAIQLSTTLCRLIEDLGCSVESNAPLPVQHSDGKTLELVFKWCEHHKNEVFPVEDKDSPKKEVVIPEFDENLLKIGSKELFDLICAADYLDVKRLMDVSCKTVALMAKGKSPEELRAIFQIPTDEEDEAAEKAEREAARKASEKQSTDKDSGEGTSTS